ncbi:hypothetical protein YYE_03448 [Plasmodium vinckei vinckei]|nr:hypothetical protein YYE_03448 [Plasmodium vinckei vinckei]
MYYLKLFLKLFVLIFFSYDFIVLKNEAVLEKGDFLKKSYDALFVQRDILPSYINQDNQISIYFYTRIYFEEEDYQLYNNYNDNNRKKYVLFLRSIKPALIYKLLSYIIFIFYILVSLIIIFPRHMEGFIPVFLLNDENFKNMFENMRKKKLATFAIMFFSYNVIYGLLCNTNIIHIYQNGRIIYNDYYIDDLFRKTLKDNLINIRI